MKSLNVKAYQIIGINADGSEVVLQPVMLGDNAAGYCANFNRICDSMRAVARRIKLPNMAKRKPRRGRRLKVVA